MELYDPRALGDQQGSRLGGCVVTMRGIGDAQLLEDLGSPADWLVLGLVIERPSHGYEIAQRYQGRFDWFLSISGSRVYAALDRLHAGGLIEEIPDEEVEGRGDARSRNRRRFRARRLGVEAFRHWVAQRMRDDQQQARLLAQVASTAMLGTDSALEVLNHFENRCGREMSRLPLLDRGLVHDGSFGDVVNSMVVDWMRRRISADLDWAQDARQVVLARARQEKHVGQD